jgi:type I restriction enzyme S subunit
MNNHINSSSTWYVSTMAAEMASIQVGIVVKPASYYVESGGVPALRSLNVRENKIYFDKLIRISREGHKLNKKSALRRGDVVTVRTGGPGKTVIIPDDIGELNCIDIIFSRPGPKVRGEYVSFFLNSRVAKRQIAVPQGGLAQQHLNVGEMKRIKILVPPLLEQDRIVTVLRSMWQRIEAEEAELKQLTSLRYALAQELLSGRLCVPESIIARHRDMRSKAA